MYKRVGPYLELALEVLIILRGLPSLESKLGQDREFFRRATTEMLDGRSEERLFEDGDDGDEAGAKDERYGGEGEGEGEEDDGGTPLPVA